MRKVDDKEIARAREKYEIVQENCNKVEKEWMKLRMLRDEAEDKLNQLLLKAGKLIEVKVYKRG